MPGAPLIVIVDDDAAVRRAIASLMESAGFASASFTSAEDCLRSGRLAECAWCAAEMAAEPRVSARGLDPRRTDAGNGLTAIAKSFVDPQRTDPHHLHLRTRREWGESAGDPSRSGGLLGQAV